jgi:glutamine---fructose-6-phosphate transaminase (isomerizing)
MNSESRYSSFALCREMLETPRLVRDLDPERYRHVDPASDRILLSGEGSSRIFPAKRLIAQSLRSGWPLRIVTEAALQAIEYRLSGYHVFVASNSGRTAEGVQLIRHVRGLSGDDAAARTTGVVANEGTLIATEADEHILLQCGGEQAVAATKSVMEQALVYDLVFRRAVGESAPDRNLLAQSLEAVLTGTIDDAITGAVAAAPRVFFAGRNDGVAEELTLKTNEITRKPSDYLEGTYAVHGIEEVLDPEDVVVLVDPYPGQEEKFARVLQEGVGLTVIAIAPRDTRFPTLRVPSADPSSLPYLLLAAGWSLLVEVGLASGVDLDKPRRARKVGNEFTGA